MADLTRLGTFAVATLVLNLTPGPDMMYVVARSMGQGRRAGVVSALGIGAGCLVHVAAAVFGISALLRSSPHAYDIVRLAGAGYLLFLGARLLLRPGAGRTLTDLRPESHTAIFRQGVVTNVFNPKVALFFLAFLPQFVAPAHGGVAWQMTALGLYFDLSGTAVNLGVACLAGVAGNFLRRGRGPELTERLSGGVFVALGLRVWLARSA